MRHLRLAGFLFAMPSLGLAMKKEELFEKVSRQLPAAAPEDDMWGTPLLNKNLVDMWEADPILKMTQRVIDGDHFGVLGEMAGAKELDDLWGDPDTLKTILTTMPMFKSIRGIDKIAAKDTLTAKDGADALGLFRKMMTTMPNKMEDVMDPKKFSKKMQEYADTPDVKLQGLYKQVELGNFTAFKELHQAVADKEWDGLIDLDAFGLNGKEPEQLKMMRTLLEKEEPDLYRLVHQDDPIVKKYIGDPTLAYNEALAAAGIKTGK